MAGLVTASPEDFPGRASALMAMAAASAWAKASAPHRSERSSERYRTKRPGGVILGW